jgi:NAD(P)-dependent dehydrogenase (short-subunit alcohol dehydrogenase family)
MTLNFALGGRSVVVTGGAAGIGAGVAAAMVEAGGKVLLVDRDPQVEAVAERMGAESSLVVDLTGPEAPAAVSEAARSAVGAVDVLVNNAGRYPVAPLADVTDDLIDEVFALNFKAALRLTRALAPHMPADASVINVGSLDAIRPSLTGLTVYGSSKAAVLAMTKHLAFELAPARIRVNAVVPGGIKTEGAQAMSESGGMTEQERDAMQAAFDAKIPLGRMGVPDDLAGPVVFLASAASRYVTGATLLVDGGLLLTS